MWLTNEEDRMAQSESFGTDREAFEAGYQLLFALRSARFGANFDSPRPEEADALVRNYCQRLRRSSSLALARIQRTYHVPDYGMILILFGSTAHFGLPLYDYSSDSAAFLATGFCPLRMLQIRNGLAGMHGFFRLLTVTTDGRLRISREMSNVLGGRKISENEVKVFRRKIATLPTWTEDEESNDGSACHLGAD
jgi:hypothetical protein